MNAIISQLIDFYHKETWHNNRLSDSEAEEYFVRLLASGNLIIMCDGDVLKGYVEFFRITPAQLRKILDKKFYVFDEDIKHGSICYINAIYITPNQRNSVAMKYLRTVFMMLNSDCKCFVGEDTRRHKTFIFSGKRVVKNRI